ncbi:MAG: type VI secretion system tip protein VgrG [Mariniphaga sp.]|nr:type VI secretion system tip protein VgrG [Mariniphaga sp.]
MANSKSKDLVTCTILLEGKELSKVHSPLSITVDKELNRIPYAKLVFIDGDPSKQDFTLSNKKLLVPGKKIEIKVGYNSKEDTVFKGVIIKNNIKIRSNQSYLIIECKDEAIRLTIGRKSQYYYESKDKEIIEEIIGSYSLKSSVEKTNYKHKELVQFNTTDWDFLVTRAQANGKVCIVDDGKVNVKKPGIKHKKIETITFGDNLLDFDAEMDARNQFKKVTSYGWDYASQELMEIEASDPSVKLNGNITTGELSSVIKLKNLELKNGGAFANVILQDWVDAKALFNQLSKVRGRIKIQGIQKVKPDTILELKGVGDSFNGNIYISAIRHTITEGNWITDAQFGIDPVWFSESVSINELPASGLLASVQGLQIGVASQLEKDPDKQDRIMVKLPIVDAKEQGIWARVASLDAGNKRGAFFRPEIGDEVILGFINNNPNDAIVLGMLHSSTKSAPIVASDDNHEKGFVTRSEMKLIFNDEKKSVTVETPAGKKLIIDENAGVITIEDENSNKINFDSGGIQIESAGKIDIKASGDVNIEGANINIKASAKMKAEGSAGVEMSSSATAVVKGAIVQIN